jgi:two-component system CheB/CheR fusion protein
MADELPPSQLVVVGSSAGGIEALSTLVATVPADFPAPIVIAHHLDPQRPSHLAEILGRHSRLPVQTILDHETLQDGHVYMVPTDRHVQIADRHLILSNDQSGRPKPSINLLFNSAAKAYGDGIIAVILTGTGSDGAAGALEVKRHGGTVVIQDPDMAQYPAMPRALAPTVVDFVAHIDEISHLLNDLLTDMDSLARPSESESLQVVLQQVHERSGLDFASYKLPTIQRRLRRRMVATDSASITAYRRYLRRYPDEYNRLISSFLIKVTEFFRDRDLFTFLREQILPDLIAHARQHGNELRLWSAGCATGEEAYSLAILIADLLGDELDQFNVRIFATDLDNDAIIFARRGIYSAAALTGLDSDLIARFFQRLDSDYEVQKRVRGMVIFGQHDLGQRAPFPRIDLILCRNVLIYFTVELQKRVLQLFAYSLRDGGYLVLGKAETTNPYTEFFTLIQSALKIYRRQGERLLMPIRQFKDMAPLRPPLVRPINSVPMPPVSLREAPRPRTTMEKLGSFVFNLPIGVAVVDRHYDIQIINSLALQLLEIHRPSLGEDLLHLAEQVPTKPLRAIIDAAMNNETPPPAVGILAVETEAGAHRHLQVLGYPHQFESEDNVIASVLLLITDITAQVQAQQQQAALLADALAATAPETQATGEAGQHQHEEIEQLTTQVQRLIAINRELREANSELTGTNLKLHQANEEYLVNTEEVQAAAEEVETLNEELQATNEELETLNEELQATVDELNATNDDLEARGTELQDLAREDEAQRRVAETERGRLAAILVSMSDAVLVVDDAGQPVLSNEAYTQVFGDASVSPPFADEDGRPLPSDALPSLRAARGETFTAVYTLAAADGARRWFEASGHPITADELPQGGVVVIRDITDRSLRRLQDEFLALASHELRTPLAASQMALQLAQRKLKDGKTIQHQLDIALRQVQHMNILVNDLMDVGRLQTGNLHLQLAPCVLQEIVRHAVEAVQITAPDRQVALDAPAEPLRVNADGIRLEQIILNLLTNAVKYAPQSQLIDVRLHHAGDKAEIVVQDYGPGIAPDQLPHLFTRFYRVAQGNQGNSEARGGLGLGLFITKELVTAHGGTITVQSQEGKGATFTVTLPLLPK